MTLWEKPFAWHVASMDWRLVVLMANVRVGVLCQGVRREVWKFFKEPVALWIDSRLAVLGFKIGVC